MLDELILELKQKDVYLYLQDGKLRCKAPRDALTPDLKATLQAHKAELIEYLLEVGQHREKSDLPIQRASRDKYLPLSYAQQRLWTLSQFDACSIAYNISSAWRLTGRVDVTALSRSLNEIVRRHEVLRTTFSMENGQPVQVIAPAVELDIATKALGHLPEDKRDSEIARYLDEQSQLPFDLTQGPLLRAALLSLSASDDSGQAEYILYFAMHHIVSDGWSMGILNREFMSLYAAFSTNCASSLPELDIQYADYAVWQREALQEEQIKQQLDYWKKQLAGAPGILELYADRLRPNMPSYRGSNYHFTVPEHIAAQLKTLGRQHDATLFMVLLSGLNILLYRYSGQRDICIGTPIANRDRLEIEGLIGFFVNTVVVRTVLADNPTFIQLLTKVKKVCLDAQAHQGLPFERLVDTLAPVRDMRHTPLFQVMFALQTVADDLLEVGGVRFARLDMDTRSAKFDLSMEVIECRHGLDAVLNYNTDLFDEATIIQMAGNFRKLLETIAVSPDKSLSDLSLLTETERKQHLLEWNAVQPVTATAQCIHQLFEARVKENPDTIAAVYENQQLSYGQLNAKANQLAHYLRAHGVGPEVLVGICTERALEMVIGIVGILKAGGAYVPFDPGYPQDRITFMLDDARPAAVLIHTATHQPLFDSVPVLDLAAQQEEIAHYSTDNPPNLCRTQNLAYVIYTSGSTGKPKGALATHENVLRLFENTQDKFGFDKHDVWTLFHSCAFDFSVWELWGALIYGGKLVVVPYWISRSPEAFYRLLCEHSVTVLNQTPSAFRSLTHIAISENDGEQRRDALRLVIFGGEALELKSLKPWFERFGYRQPQLVNMYGITETTVHVTYFPLHSDVIGKSLGSPIGRPIEDLQVYVLDAHYNLQPAGVPGELYVGGAGLVRGYLSRANLTAERFVPNPFNVQSGQRLYRTGDLARYRADGTIEYLGRIDQQVKIRGFRIELGEIEAALLQHEQVRETTVVVREDSPGDKYLVGYVAGDEATEIDAIRAHLKSRLPEYMIPSAFVLLDKLPLTTNGKVDRKALPAPNISDQLAHGYVAPRNSAEEILAWVWVQILAVDHVGIDDNFFELGGDSIRSVQVVGLAKEKALFFSVEQLYRNPTIRELAQSVAKHAQPDHFTRTLMPFDLVAFEDKAKFSEHIENAYPLTSLQAGMIFHSQSDKRAYHIFDSVTLQCPFNQHYLESALTDVFNLHPILRTVFDFENFSEPLQLVHKKPVVSLQCSDLRHCDSAVQSDRVSAWRESEKCNYFNIDQLPLIRFHVHRLTDAQFQFSATEHHAVLDGWSLTSMLNEVFQRYFNLLESDTSSDEVRAVDDGMQKLVAIEKNALTADQYRDYWIRQLSTLEISLLPQLSAVAAQKTTAGNHWNQSKDKLPSHLSDKLLELARTLGVPLKSVLLAAHIRVLSILLGKSNVTSGLVFNVRPETRDSEHALGVFLNTLPFSQKITDASWQGFITQTFDLECQLLQVRYYPLAALQRMRGNEPLFDVVFNYTHYRVGEDILQSNKLKMVEWENAIPPNFSLEVGFDLQILSSEIELELSGSRIDTARLERIRDCFIAVFNHMVDDPAASVGGHAFLSAVEQRQLHDWNATDAAYTSDCCIHQLFELRAEQTPQAIAVDFAGQQLTYGQLNAKANQLAHYLRTRGVGPEVVVGLCVERSLEMVIGLLGILKAGGAYMPIDPRYPQERIAFMLDDARPALNLVHAATRAILSDTKQVVDLDAQWEKIAQYREDNPSHTARTQNLAYVIYTSGSTGKPKGAALMHGGIVNRLEWMQRQYRLDAQDRVLQKTPFSFDVSVWEFFWPLLAGARLVIAPLGAHRDGRHIARIVQDETITVMHFVPSMLSAFLDVPDVAACKSLRHVICSGEALSANLQNTFYETLPAQLHNLYGPTEASIDVTAWACERDSKDTVVPIGRPIANTRIYLLDAFLNPVPVGVPGELYIGGVGLARGYQNRSALTAERFIPDPFSERPGARLYRTGDLARYRADGEIEYIGRTDHQVKIRGFRIELGEIEAALLQHDQIKEAVAIVREDTADDKRLVAYLVGNELPPDIETIRKHLQTGLPDYMIPTAFVCLDNLPLSANGKLDHKALPAPDAGDRLTHEYVAPRNPTEQILAGIWGEVLGVEKVGVYDNFFELGGHSLLVMQILAKVRMTFDIDVPLETLFKTPTVGDLAQRIEEMIMAEVEALSEAEAERIAQNASINRG